MDTASLASKSLFFPHPQLRFDAILRDIPPLLPSQGDPVTVRRRFEPMEVRFYRRDIPTEIDCDLACHGRICRTCCVNDVLVLVDVDGNAIHKYTLAVLSFASARETRASSCDNQAALRVLTWTAIGLGFARMDPASVAFD